MAPARRASAFLGLGTLVVLVTFALLAALPAAGAGSAFEAIKGSLALVGYPVDDKRLTIAFGTGFCVSSSASKSYYVTNDHVVTDALGNLVPNVFVILPKDPGTRHKATVVRHSADPDLAIVSVDLPCDVTVKVSPDVPDEGDDIAIAGFPYTEVCELAGLCSPGLVVPNAHTGRLLPVLSRGTVNEAQEGTYSILYDALADHGNSGGPLFDFHSGTVYGVVVDALPGYSDEGTPPQNKYNRAIAIGVGLPFINGAPISVAVAPGVGGSRGVGDATDRYTEESLGSGECRAAWRAFDRAYGEWAQLHGKLRSLAEYLAEPANAGRKNDLQPVAAQLAARETGVLAEMKAELAKLQGANAPGVFKRATALADAVKGATASDAAAAASLGMAGTPGGGDVAEAALRTAAQAMDALSACL